MDTWCGVLREWRAKHGHGRSMMWRGKKMVEACCGVQMGWQEHVGVAIANGLCIGVFQNPLQDQSLLNWDSTNGGTLLASARQAVVNDTPWIRV
eukprot:1148778-Pelagomonas_calceolata.AAC.3